MDTSNIDVGKLMRSPFMMVAAVLLAILLVLNFFAEMVWMAIGAGVLFLVYKYRAEIKRFIDDFKKEV